MMKVTFQIDHDKYQLHAPPLDVVRLVASVRGIYGVDVETFPEKVSIKSDAFSVNGPDMETVCVKFIRRALESDNV